MAKYNGPYEPVNMNEGIALEVERDEFGNFTHTLWVDGEVYQITENAWEKLMRFNFDRFEEGRQSKEEEIIQLLEERAKDFLRSEYDRWLRNEVVIFDTEGLIALIKGEK